jgi:LmbE family N-acetylglucosaminyl deacetylase
MIPSKKAAISRCLPVCFLFIFSFSFVQAQLTPPVVNSATIYKQLKKLNVLGSVLYIAAHPDDENNGFLPYLAKEKLYRTGYLSLTRGDGGQNLIGPEQGIELGMIRTQELLAARRMDGAEQYFSSAYEFGYSKNAAEALSIWNKAQVLEDMVWVIRQFQPDILIARFPADARAGHGHHWASGILANEAFKAAASDTMFVEQFKRGVKPWQAKRILWNGFNFGTNASTNGPLKMDVGAYDPILGQSSGEIGGEARSMHKSQGEGRPRRRGEIIENFMTTGGDTARKDIMEGVVTDWTRLPRGEEVQELLNQIIKAYDFEYPEKSVSKLVELYGLIQSLGLTYPLGTAMPSEPAMKNMSLWKQQKAEEVKDLIINCSGIFAEATTREEFVLQNDSAAVTISVNKRNNTPVLLRSVVLDRSRIELAQQLEQNRNYNFDLKEEAYEPAISKATQPYWLRLPQTTGNFTIPDPTLVGKAWNDALLNATFYFVINDTEFRITRPVQYKYVDAVKGELYQPFVMVPRISMSLSPHVALLNVKTESGKKASDSIKIVYRSNFTQSAVPVTLYILQDTVKTVFEKQPRDFEKGKSYTIALPLKNYYKPFQEYIEAAMRITVSSNIRAERMEGYFDSAKKEWIGAASKVTGRTRDYQFSQYFKSIEYDHIPNIYYSFKDHIKFVPEEIRTVGRKIGYISGAGDMLPEALTEMGYEVTTLSRSDITDEGLKRFDAIVIGIRAHNIYEWLSDKNDVLNNYVFNGGSLISQYIKSNNIGSKRLKLGPYPFSISAGSRVTEENAKVDFLLPQHAILNYPNKITDKDFAGWIQERSTYQVDQMDPHYEALLGMNDTNEKQSNGSLVTTKYGKGNFTYVSLALFRQLPGGIAGAYKLLANIIALPKNK